MPEYTEEIQMWKNEVSKVTLQKIKTIDRYKKINRYKNVLSDKPAILKSQFFPGH